MLLPAFVVAGVLNAAVPAPAEAARFYPCGCPMPEPVARNVLVLEKGRYAPAVPQDCAENLVTTSIPMSVAAVPLVMHLEKGRYVAGPAPVMIVAPTQSVASTGSRLVLDKGRYVPVR
jgi:hypothetical protein